LQANKMVAADSNNSGFFMLDFFNEEYLLPVIIKTQMWSFKQKVG